MIVEVEQIEDAAKHLHNLLQGATEQIKMIDKQLSLCDLEVSDLLHAIEYSNFHASDGYKLAKDLKITLLQRRKLKDERATLSSLNFKMNESKSFLVHTEDCFKQIQKKKLEISSRYLKTKVRSDLIERFNKSNKSKLLK